MSKWSKQRQTEVLSRYPTIKSTFDELYVTRCDEIIDELLEFDENYKLLNQQRADTSQIVLEFMKEHNMAEHFENYSDAMFAEELYVLNAVYKSAFIDAIEEIEKQ